MENGAIVEVNHEPDEFISSIFVRPKKNGEHRVILNLKNLNEFIPYHHFKMDTFESAVNLLVKDCFMVSIDIRHAYHTIPIAEEHQKFLRFIWKEKIFQYTCLPFGLSSAPRIFTKVLKPVFARLRMLGFVNISYIDDILLMGNSENDCNVNVQHTKLSLEKLGFVINENKSIFKPTKEIVFLGNIINSESMTVELTKEKKDTLYAECKSLFEKNQAKIREVARIIGLIVSSFSAVDFGPLHYRILEREKIIALRDAHGNFEQFMNITEEMKQELSWWMENVHKQIRIISRGNPEITIKTDASLIGWGATTGNQETSGRWTCEESTHHINYLELLAIFMALRSFSDRVRNKFVRIMSDNTSAVSYINNMGGIKSDACNSVAMDIWYWCVENNVWIVCTHIPGKENIDADRLSREFNDQIEWRLDHDIFLEICLKMIMPEIDLFATRINTQLDTFCSWRKDPDCSYVDAFSLNWGNFNAVYIFPPFSLLNSCIRKIREDQTRGIIIAPLWPTQIWFPRLMQILVRNPIILPKKNNLLTNPCTMELHPLRKKLVLIACLVSGRYTENKDFLRKLPELSWHHGNPELNDNITLSSRDGFSTAVDGKLIQFHQL